MEKNGPQAFIWDHFMEEKGPCAFVWDHFMEEKDPFESEIAVKYKLPTEAMM